MSMKEFIIEDNLSNIELENVRLFINKISELKELNSSAFCGYPYFEGDKDNSILKCAIINERGINILINNEGELKRYKRYIKKILLSSELIADKMDEVDIFNPVYVGELNSKENLLPQRNILTREELTEIISLFQNTFNLIKFDERKIEKEGSIGFCIKKRSEEIANFDENQFNGIYTKRDSNLRIRGLAGSGKTIVLVKKMAYMHFKNPEANLCYVFYTISLKQYIMKLFCDFYKEFVPYGEPDFSKINIMHCWGGKYNEGFYSKICNVSNNAPISYSMGTSLESITEDLLDTLKYDLNIYDYVFLDEAQDFGINFFHLILKSLKENGKLIYAYDEMQTLGDNKKSVPTKNEIFGNRECEDIDLKTCYRTPKEILVTAHALGLGIYRDVENPIVNMIEDIKVWESIGYEVIDGNLKYGSYVKLDRKQIYSNLIPDPIRFQKFTNSTQQYEYVTNEIKQLIENEEVLADDILIIDLDDKNIKKNSMKFKEIFYTHLEDNINFFNTGQWLNTINVVDKDNPKLFKLENSIAYTTIYRAKGNEANIVFILNSDAISSLESTSRNSLFTAMTRSKFLVYILDSNGTTYYDEEIKRVKDNNYTLEFNYPTKSELRKIRTNSKSEITVIKSMDNAVKSFRNAVEHNKKLELDLLLQQTGKDNIDELLQYLKDMKDKTDE